ncbi:MAG TPA: response regulator [Verrucomicrobiae bacterium]|nr:response regulator [Verrucomicrobiae bacterium]
MSTILLVDDDDSLSLLLHLAIRRSGRLIQLSYVGDGQEAVAYLTPNAGTGDINHPLPSLILLDLKMPRMNGFEVLEWKRTQPRLEKIPVIIWSSSSLAQDKERALQLGATSYFVKPMETEGFVELLKALETYSLVASVS